MIKRLVLLNVHSTLILISLIICTAQNVAQAQPTFTDSTFSKGWTSVLLPTSVSGSTCTAIYDKASGNPKPGRTTTHTYPTGLIECAHLFSPALFNPANQRIISLTYAYDL